MPRPAGCRAEDVPWASQTWVLLHPEVPRAAQALVNANAVQKSSGWDPEGIADGDLITPPSALSLFCSRWLVCEGLKALLEAARSVPHVTERGEEGGCLWCPEGEQEHTTSSYRECNTQGEQIQRPSPNRVDASPYFSSRDLQQQPLAWAAQPRAGQKPHQQLCQGLIPFLVCARVPQPWGDEALRVHKQGSACKTVLHVLDALSWISRSSWEHSGRLGGVLQNWGQL